MQATELLLHPNLLGQHAIALTEILWELRAQETRSVSDQHQILLVA